MRSFFQRLAWVNDHLLLLLSLFLLAFIPLFPKIPLFDAIPGYIVKVRAEDFLVGLTALVWIRDVIRKKIAWNTIYFWFVIAYICAGLLSILFGIILLDTIPKQLLHIGKSGLTFFRYIEYFSLFFFTIGSIRTHKERLAAIFIVIATLVGVIGYGFGQKYARLPAYSTMNREYSKGERLYLSPGDKVQSTFAGHYDLAAYLALLLPLIIALSLSTPFGSRLKNSILFCALQGIHLVGVILLLLSGSATSLIGYGVATGVTALLLLLRLPTWKMRLLWGGAGLLLALTAAVGVWMIAPSATKEKIVHVIQGSRTRSAALPQDLVGDGTEDKIIKTAQPDGSIKTSTVRVKSSWSPNALKYGITMGIRLDTLWPQALLGLARNPMTGSSYGTLTTADTGAFTEADSTDNNFLRSLGETGFFGSLVFYGYVLLVLMSVFSQRKDTHSLTAALSIGWTGATIGLLVAALTLDVFAASKVAFTFWALSGLFIEKQFSFLSLKQHLFRYATLYTGIALTLFFLHQNPFLQHTPVNDIDQATSGIQEITAARCFIENGVFSLCRNSGLPGLPHTTLMALLLVPLYTLTHYWGVFSYVTIGCILLGEVIAWKLSMRYIRWWSAITSTLVITGVGMLFRWTQAPLTSLQLIALGVGVPLSWILTSLFLSRIRLPVIMQVGIIALVLGGVTLIAVREPISSRYQNRVANDAASLIRLANAYVHVEDKKKNYLLTSLDPYFADLYALDTYTVLPLSANQPYGSRGLDVWEASFSAELLQDEHVYVSDLYAQKGQTFAADFTALKHAYDLTYTDLGCSERCNILRISPLRTLISPTPLSILPTKKLEPVTLPTSYDFALIPNVFDPVLQDTTITYTSAVFALRLEPLRLENEQFAIITGDVSHKPEKIHADFLSGFAKQISYPILYSKGNEKLAPVKYFPGEFASFYTQQEFFILLPTDPNSHLNTDDQLGLYNALLTLEKLPEVKHLFVISHDLNWQDTSDPENAIHIIKRKLAEFPGLSVTILTANHKQGLGKASNWFDTQTDGNITYASALTAGNTLDTYLQIHVDHGNVTIAPKLLTP